MDPRRSIVKCWIWIVLKPMLSKTQIKTQGFVQMNCAGAGLYIHVHCTINAHTIITICKLFIKFTDRDSLQNSRDLFFFQHPGQRKDQDPVFCPNTLLTKPMLPGGPVR